MRDGLVGANLENLSESLREAGERAYARAVAKIEPEYKREYSILTSRDEVTKDLARVGLSVEMALQDIMLLLGRAQEIGFRLAKQSREGSIETVQEQANMLLRVLQQVLVGARDVQSMFRPSRHWRQVLKIEPVPEKIFGVYSGLLERLDISYSKSAASKSILIMNTNDDSRLWHALIKRPTIAYCDPDFEGYRIEIVDLRIAQ